MQPQVLLKTSQHDSTPESSIEYQPMAILEVDLGEALPTLSAMNKQTGEPYQRTLCLVRLHSQPIGRIELALPDGQASPEEYAPRIWDALHTQINEHLQEDDLPPVTTLDASGLIPPAKPRCLAE